MDGVARQVAFPDQLCIANSFPVRSGVYGSCFSSEGAFDGWGRIEVPERGFSGWYPWTNSSDTAEVGSVYWAHVSKVYG